LTKRLAVLIQSTCVTHRQTDAHTDGIAIAYTHASIVSHG